MSNLFRKINKIADKIKYAYNLNKANNAPIDNLESLSFDIKGLKTIEECPQNDFYYNAWHLKKYCGYPTSLSLKCVVEHCGCAPWSNYVWDADYKNDLKGFISVAEIRREHIKNVCDKKYYPIGPYIRYVDSFMSEKQIAEEKKKWGKTLTVFPLHSTHHVKGSYDVEKFCDEIEKIKNEHGFDSVKICMYWKDILHNTHKIYQHRGFDCVCAGHIFSKNFLPRLKSIIELSDVIMSNSLSTHVAFAMALQKPVYIFEQEYKYESNEIAKEQFKNEKGNDKECEKNKAEIIKIFSGFSETITPAQLEMAEKYFSISIFKTKKELYDIFSEFRNSK